jgi:hypothetical protein
MKIILIPFYKHLLTWYISFLEKESRRRKENHNESKQPTYVDIKKYVIIFLMFSQANQ